MLDYLTGKVKESPRKDFMYVNDDGQVVAIRYDAWKVVFLENRGQAFGIWREPFTELRVPLLFNLRRDPFERAQHNANIYNDWFLERAFVLVPPAGNGRKIPHVDEGLSAQPDTGLVQSGEDPEADQNYGTRRMTLVIRLHLRSFAGAAGSTGLKISQIT